MRLTRILTALAAALLAAFCLPAAGVAQASAESPCDAVVSPADGGETAPLFARAGDSESLMDYYRGARRLLARADRAQGRGACGLHARGRPAL